MKKSTIQDVINSSDVIWDAVCAYEDGDSATAFDMIKNVSDADRVLFFEETVRIEKKLASETEAAPRVKSVVGRGFTWDGLADAYSILERQEKESDYLLN